MKKQSFIILAAALSSVLVPCSLPLAAFGEQGQGVEVVETKLDFENAVKENESGGAKGSADDQAIDQQQVTQLNKNLKNIISDNKKLKDQLKQLQDQLATSRGQAEIEHNRANAENLQKEAVAQKAQELTATVAQLQQKLEETQKIAVPESPSTEKGASDKTESVAAVTTTPAENEKTETEVNAVVTSNGNPNIMGMISRIDSLHQENEQLKSDAAKVHYNIGNVYFQKGEYAKAQAEYQQSVDLMPYDPFAHYNLAFVSGEYLDDPQTALTHYRRYLFLNPQAEDAPMVKEKILAAELLMRTKIESDLDPIRVKELQKQKAQILEQKQKNKDDQTIKNAVKAHR